MQKYQKRQKDTKIQVLVWNFLYRAVVEQLVQYKYSIQQYTVYAIKKHVPAIHISYNLSIEYRGSPILYYVFETRMQVETDLRNPSQRSSLLPRFPKKWTMRVVSTACRRCSPSSSSTYSSLGCPSPWEPSSPSLVFCPRLSFHAWLKIFSICAIKEKYHR